MEATRYDLAKLRADMELRGWLPIDLARAANVSDMTVYRFLSGVRANPRTALKLAQGLGYSVRRYRLVTDGESSTPVAGSMRGGR